MWETLKACWMSLVTSSTFCVYGGGGGGGGGGEGGDQ